MGKRKPAVRTGVKKSAIKPGSVRDVRLAGTSGTQSTPLGGWVLDFSISFFNLRAAAEVEVQKIRAIISRDDEVTGDNGIPERSRWGKSR